jgi:hypothetical protein
MTHSPYLSTVEITGISAALDLVTMLDLFMGFRSELSPSARNPEPAPLREQGDRGELPSGS